jgi:hypothetical protein
MNNNLEFENEDPSPDSIEDNHPRTNYGEGYGGKETLEEAAENYGKDIGNKDGTAQFDFIRGAKWQAERMGLMEIELRHTKTFLASCEKALEDRDKQAERMYSEEDLKHAFFSGCQSERQIKPRIACWEEWFEQFKKNKQ